MDVRGKPHLPCSPHAQSMLKGIEIIMLFKSEFRNIVK